MCHCGPIPQMPEMSEHPLTTPNGDGNIPLSSVAVNGANEISAPKPPTNSQQLPSQSTASYNQIPRESSPLTVVNPKKKEWKYSRRLWCLVTIIIAISLGISIGFALRIRDFSVPSKTGSFNSTIPLVALLVDIDPHLETMTVDWLVARPMTCDSHPCPIYDIFIDSSLLVSGENNDMKPSANNSISKTPIFSIDTAVNSNFSNSLFFTTKVSLLPGISTDKISTRSLQSYPFDRYLAKIAIFSKNRNDSSDDFSHLVPISIIASGGIAAGFTTKVNTSEDIYKNGDFVNLFIDISRGIEVQIYAIAIIMAIWLVTLVLLSSTISAVVLGHRIVKEVLLIPVATLFAFTSLRGTMPSAPQGFGAIMDYIGILPCLSILTFCAVVHVGIFLIRNPEKDRSDVEKRRLDE